MQVCALIMTPLPLEYAAAIKHVGGQHEKIFKDQAVYVRGTFKGNHHDYAVVVCEPGMRNVDMALATERAIQRFSPSIVLLMGIAGGIKDLKKGDVAIASSAFNYDSGKELENQFLPRPVEFHFSKELLAYAKDISRSDNWKKRTSDGAPQANILIAPVASGDKVVAAVHNPTYDRIVQYLSHCKFLEMEAGGFGLAVQPYRDLHALVIRGISDMCAGKAETDLENWQAVAAERAAAVAFEMLWEMDGAIVGITGSQVKKIGYSVKFNQFLKNNRTVSILVPLCLFGLGYWLFIYKTSLSGSSIDTFSVQKKDTLTQQINKVAKKNPQSIKSLGALDTSNDIVGLIALSDEGGEISQFMMTEILASLKKNNPRIRLSDKYQVKKYSTSVVCGLSAKLLEEKKIFGEKVLSYDVRLKVQYIKVGTNQICSERIFNAIVDANTMDSNEKIKEQGLTEIINQRISIDSIFFSCN